MTLSVNEKEQLLDFIKSHYVDHHDVRLLIAKDLKENITKLMEEEKTLSFEEALKQAYAKYGVIGFSNMSEDYMKKINAYFYKKVIFGILKDEAITLRFWLFSILSFLIIYAVILSLNSMPFILSSTFIVVFVSGLIFYLRKLHKEIKKLKKEGHYTYFDQLLVTNNTVLFPFTYLPLLIASYIGILIETEMWNIAILSFFTVISLIAFYMIYFKIYKNRQRLKREYEENFLYEKLNCQLKVV